VRVLRRDAALRPVLTGEVLEVARRHALDHVDAFVEVASGERSPDDQRTDFVRELAARAARRGLDLAGLIGAYRLAARVQADWIADQAASSPAAAQAGLGLLRLLMEYASQAASVLADAYGRERDAMLVESEAAADRLLEDLLAGRRPRLLDVSARQAGLDARGSFETAVVVADDVPAAADALRRQLAQAGVAHLALARPHELVVVVPAQASPWRAIERAPAARAWRAGVGLPSSGLEGVRRGYDEAHQALALASRGQVLRLSEVRLFDYLVAYAPDTAKRLVPRELQELDGVQRRTLLAFAECDLNALQAARRLHVHPNTLHNRLRQIQTVTGHDPRRLTELVDLLVGLRLQPAPAD
jgi:DNA-binding PucR family transcriptional regulator